MKRMKETWLFISIEQTGRSSKLKTVEHMTNNIVGEDKQIFNDLQQPHLFPPVTREKYVFR